MSVPPLPGRADQIHWMEMGGPCGFEECPVHPIMFCPGLGEDGGEAAVTVIASVGGGGLSLTSPLPVPPGPQGTPSLTSVSKVRKQTSQ